MYKSHNTALAREFRFMPFDKNYNFEADIRHKEPNIEQLKIKAFLGMLLR